MKHLLLALFLVLALAGTAKADSVTVGGKPVSFTPPTGYVHAEGEAYASLIGALREAFADSLTFHALYVEKSVDDALKNGTENHFDRYLVIASDPDSASKKATKAMLIGAKYGFRLTRNSDSYRTVKLMEEEDTRCTYLTLGKTADAKGGFDILTANSFVLTQSKLLIIYQFYFSETAERSETQAIFVQDALKVMASMTFPDPPENTGGRAYGFTEKIAIAVSIAFLGIFFVAWRRAVRRDKERRSSSE